jgi:hypothetical protein
VFDDERVSDVSRVGNWKILMMFMIFSNASQKVKIFDIEGAAFVKKVVNAFG